LEEAMGFRSLLDLKDAKYTINSIAARAGKSEAYVLGQPGNVACNRDILSLGIYRKVIAHGENWTLVPVLTLCS
jgi:hypothetical protein